MSLSSQATTGMRQDTGVAAQLCAEECQHICEHTAVYMLDAVRVLLHLQALHDGLVQRRALATVRRGAAVEPRVLQGLPRRRPLLRVPAHQMRPARAVRLQRQNPAGTPK